MDVLYCISLSVGFRTVNAHWYGSLYVRLTPTCFATKPQEIAENEEEVGERFSYQALIFLARLMKVLYESLFCTSL